MSEWFKETVLKTVVPATVPWVRIPPLPPAKQVGYDNAMKSYQFKNQRQRIVFTLISFAGVFGILIASAVSRIPESLNGFGIVVYAAVIGLACVGWNACVAQIMNVNLGDNK